MNDQVQLQWNFSPASPVIGFIMNSMDHFQFQSVGRLL
jgi:hypothetical protein